MNRKTNAEKSAENLAKTAAYLTARGWEVDPQAEGVFHFKTACCETYGATNEESCFEVAGASSDILVRHRILTVGFFAEVTRFEFLANQFEKASTQNGCSFPGGMSLRDYFAGQAMMGFCANPAVFRENSDCGWKLVNTTEDGLAAYCISIADALLAERAKAGGGK